MNSGEGKPSGVYRLLIWIFTLHVFQIDVEAEPAGVVRAPFCRRSRSQVAIPVRGALERRSWPVAMAVASSCLRVSSLKVKTKMKSTRFRSLGHESGGTSVLLT